jgi:DNA-binding response OmpR family regulator
MPVVTFPLRAGRHPTESAPAAVTVTVAIPLGAQAMSPQAHRLLDALREFVESGEGTVTVDPSAPGTSAVGRGAADPASADVARSAVVHPHEVSILAASRQALLGGEPLPLTRLEFDLLLFLARQPRRVFSRVQLLAGVWGYEHTGVRTVDVHVRRLRLKAGDEVPLVTTVYGVGYRLADDARVVIRPDE